MLGPILYAVYTSDIPTPTSCSVSMYADDTAVFTSSGTTSEIQTTLQVAMTLFMEYFHKWKIKLNLKKTACILFTNKRSKKLLPQTNLNLGASNVPWVDSIKYLGVYLDQRLTFQSHVQNTTEKISKTIRILYPFINRKSHLSVEYKLLIVKSIFIPILLYGCPVWGDCAPTHIKKLQIAQNKVLKLCLDLPYYFSTTKLHKKANINLIITNIAKYTA